MGVMQSSGTSESPLLSLPPEIRNIIYREVLAHGAIQMSAIVLEPPLLRVSRQIRDETMQIYYKENTFEWTALSFDAKDYLAWIQALPARKHTSCSWTLGGAPNWNNLQRWLKAYHEGKSVRLRPVDPKTVPIQVRWTAIAAFLFDSVRVMGKQGLSWADIAANLGMTRSALCVLDERWEL